MTHTDPSEPAAWAEAAALAASQNQGAVEKRSDALPFLFAAQRQRSVLVHKGAIVRERGPAIAGAYLRDLGITTGRGPGLADVLWTLWALDALPDVAPLPSDGYVHAPDDPKLADLNPFVHFDGTSAAVVLNYFTDDGPPPAPAAPTGPIATGARLEGWVPAVTRDIVRMTLTIPSTGTASWRREDLTWAVPE